jgi:AbiU2
VRVPGLVASLQSEPAVPTEVAEQIERALTGAEPAVAKIRLLRDKVFAHRDRSYSYERAFEEAGLTPDEVGQLTAFEHYTERALLALLRDLHTAEGLGQ